MKKAFTYFLLQTKRIFRFMPSILIFTLILCIISSVALNIIIEKNENNDRDTKLTIGVVGETEDSYLGFGFVTIMELDISRFSIDFQNLSESDARAKLEKGELSAYVVIPDNFIENASHGDIMPLKYVASSSDVGITEVFKTEILNGLVDILETSQRAIYGFEEAIEDNGGKAGISNRMNILYEKYVSLIMSRSESCKTESLGYSSSVSYLGYYLCAVIIVFLSLWGICSTPHFAKKQIALSRLLASKGVGSFGQVFGEYLSYLIAMLVTFALVISSFTLILSDSITEIPEIQSISQFIEFSLLLIPVIFAISTMQFLLFEAISETAPCCMAQFTVSISFSYAAGLFYPIDFLPKAMQALSRFLPTGIAREYGTSLLQGKFDIVKFSLLIIFATLFVVASALIRRSKIKGRLSVNL